jgi:putative endonuclease
MCVYLLHYAEPIGDLNNPRGQAQHYLGFSDDLEQRLEAHRHGNGAALPAAFAAQGIPFIVARVWTDGDRTLERRLKNWHKHSQLCPVCKALAKGESIDSLELPVQCTVL